VGSRLVAGLSPCARAGDRRFHDAGNRFGGSAGCPRYGAFSSPERAFGPSLWHPCRASRIVTAVLSHGAVTIELRQDRTYRAPRERGSASTARDAFHRRMTDSSCRAGGRFRPYARLNQPFIVAATLPPLRASRHFFARSTCSRLLLANRNRFSLLGSGRANRYSVRRDRFFASSSQASSVDFCNTHRRAGTPSRASVPRPNERPRSLRSFHHRHADDGDGPTPRLAFACATWAGVPASKGLANELPSSRHHPSTRVAGPRRDVGWRLPVATTNRPRSTFTAAPRRATASDGPRCFPPNWNPRDITRALGKDCPRDRWTASLSRRPHSRDTGHCSRESRL